MALFQKVMILIRFKLLDEPHMQLNGKTSELSKQILIQSFTKFINEESEKNPENGAFSIENTDYNMTQRVLLLNQFIKNIIEWNPRFTVPGSMEKFIELQGDVIRVKNRAEKLTNFIENKGCHYANQEEYEEINEYDPEPTEETGEDFSQIEKQINPNETCG